MRSPTNPFSCSTNMKTSPFFSISPLNFLVAAEMCFWWEESHNSSHPLVKMWDYFHCQVDYLWIYKYCIFFASVIQNSDLLIWDESTMTNIIFPVSFSKNYSSNYVAHGTSQFSITWEYQKRKFGKCDLSSSIDIIGSPLKESITEHFPSLDSTFYPTLTSGFCTL